MSTSEEKVSEKPKMEYPPQLKWMLKRALEDPEGFWGEVAEELYWFKRWDKVFEWNYPDFTWFKGGVTNIAYNCLEYNVKRGRGNHTAIIWENGEGLPPRALTYNQLLYEVKRFASALKALGVNKGDRVTIYMPMIPEAVVAMLATTRIGAIHSVVFGGFGYGALADRISDAESKIVVTADVGYRRGKTINLKGVVDEALKISGKSVQKVIVLKRGEKEPPIMPGRDILWEEAIEKGKDVKADVEKMRADDQPSSCTLLERWLNRRELFNPTAAIKFTFTLWENGFTTCTRQTFGGQHQT